jgi:hypothetical protein
MVAARDAAGWNLTSETPYWLVCTLIFTWGAWGLYAVMKEFQRVAQAGGEDTASPAFR